MRLGHCALGTGRGSLVAGGWALGAGRFALGAGIWSLDDGRHPGDDNLNEVVMQGPNGDGRYVGTVPGQSQRRNVVSSYRRILVSSYPRNVVTS